MVGKRERGQGKRRGQMAAAGAAAAEAALPAPKRTDTLQNPPKMSNPTKKEKEGASKKMCSVGTRVALPKEARHRWRKCENSQGGGSARGRSVWWRITGEGDATRKKKRGRKARKRERKKK